MGRKLVYTITERELFDSELMRKGILDVKSRGFDSIHLDYRNTRFGFSSERTRNAIKDFTKIAHENEIGIYLHAFPGVLNYNISETNPELFIDAIDPYFSEIIDGKFILSTDGERQHWEIEKCYIINKSSESSLSSCIDITDKIRFIKAIETDGGCKMTRQTKATHTSNQYEVDGFSEGQLFILVKKLFQYSVIDYSNKNTYSLNDKMLDIVNGFEVVGYVWDEPHYGFAFLNNGRPISNSIYDCFLKKFNYDLKDNLVSLWFDVEGSNSSIVRSNFSELLESTLYDFEMDFKEKVKQKSKEINKNLLVVGHRTMHEEISDDIFIGSSDYFRHAKSTDTGYTDSVYEREDSMITMFQLASSLAATVESKVAYNMCWGFNPTVEQNDYYGSLLSAMNIGWNSHAYHSSSIFGPGFPNHPIWDTIKNDTQEHFNAQQLLSGGVRINDTAILYTWKALASYPNNYIHTHRRNLLFMSKEMTLNNVQHQFISYEILENAKIENGLIKTEVGSFKKLIIPWANLITKGTFEKIVECKQSGIEVVIFGPSLENLDNGENATKEFLELCGIKSVVQHTMNMGQAVEILGNNLEFNAEKIQHNYLSNDETSYPKNYLYRSLTINDNSQAIATIDNKVVGVKDKTISYFAFELPFVVDAIKNLFDNKIQAPKNLIVFEYSTNNGKILSGVSRMNELIGDEFIWENKKIVLNKCKMFVLKLNNDSSIELFSTGDVKII